MRFLYCLAVFALLASPKLFAQAALRPGDSVDLRLFGVPLEESQQFSAPYTIDGNGNINLPYIGELKAGGLMPNQLQVAIENKLKSDGIYTHPTISIQSQLGQRFVNVGGAVRQPGRIPYTPDLTLMSAINAAGGPNDFAKQIAYLTREGKRLQYDLKQLRKDPATDPKIVPGDSIEVPQSLW